MTTLAVLNPTQLVAQELRKRLDDQPGFYDELRLLTTVEEEVGTLTESRGAAAVVQRLEAATLEGVDLVFVCGPLAVNRGTLESLPAAVRIVILSIDATLEDGVPLVAGVNLDQAPTERVLVSPNPATVHLAHLLHPLRTLGVRRAVATVLQPASVFGGSALDDLFEQARSLLSFQPIAASVAFERQIVFNLLPTDLPTELVARQLTAVLDAPGTIAAQVVQAGVFHSSTASLYVELGQPDATAEDLLDALRGHPEIEVAEADAEPFGPVDAASSEKVLVGHLKPFGTPAGGFWLWSVMDNLTRGGALNALAIARAVLG